MPFLTFHTSARRCHSQRRELMQEGGAAAVKLEGVADRRVVRALTDTGIPVMGHLGLLPQPVHQLGGFAPSERPARSGTMIADAHALEDAGAFALVLESIPRTRRPRDQRSRHPDHRHRRRDPAATDRFWSATMHSGSSQGSVPRFAKRCARSRGGDDVSDSAYIDDVRTGTFPLRNTRSPGSLQHPLRE